jgi:glycerol-3-phosphate dehydrogenase (NAD(P)+)
MPEKIGVIGAGAWGTAIAKVLAERGHEVTLWANEAETVRMIREEGENRRFLPGVRLPAGLSAEGDPLAAASGKDVIFLAVPSPWLMAVLRRILPAPQVLDGESLIVTVTKGFMPGPEGPRLILEALEDRLPGSYRDSLVYLSGPSHAEEVSRGKITGLVAASKSARNAIRTRALFAGSRVLVFPSFDTVGVQACAAAKNVIAIAFGMLDALVAAQGPDGGPFGDNTESLLLAAGLNEIHALGQALGATHPETFSSIAGIGDLDVTCRSAYGRNRRFGREIVEKDILAPFSGISDLLSRIGELGYLPEGAVAVSQVGDIAARRGISLPLMQGVYRMLDRKIAPQDFIGEYLASFGVAEAGA